MSGAGARLRSVLHDLGSRAEYEAAQERRRATLAGTQPVARLEPRSRARVSGVLRSVMRCASTSVPVLEAELFDGSGALRLLWLGQRTIRGVEPGRRMVVEGFVCAGDDGRPTLYNPRYELSPDEEDDR